MNPPENNINIWHRLLRPGSQANMTKLSARYMVPGFNTSHKNSRRVSHWKSKLWFYLPAHRWRPSTHPPPHLPSLVSPSPIPPHPPSTFFFCPQTKLLVSFLLHKHIKALQWTYVWLVLNIFHQPTMLTSLQWLELTQDDPQWPKTYSCMGQCIQIDSIKN